MHTLKMISYCLAILLLFSTAINAQQLTLSTGADWKDALLLHSLKPAESYMATTNYNNYPRISAAQWTHSGYRITYRSLMRFELSAIPQGAVVQSATLYMDSDPAFTSGELSNSTLSGSNAIYFQRVTSTWDPTTVTWNTQPSTTTTNRVWVGPSASATENIQVNLTTLIQDMVNNPSANYGIMMVLENELYYRSRHYASTNHANTAIHPKLVINFVPPDDISLAYKNEIESIFQHVDRNYVGTGLLSDYGLFFTNIEKFNGIPSDTNYIEYSEWQFLYTSLFSSRFNTNASLQEPAEVFDQISDTAVANSGIIVLAGMHFNYERFKDDATSSNLVYVSENKIYDTPDRPSTPYELREAFAIVPIRSSLNGNTHSFMFKPELFYSNTGKIISSVQADFADGGGYRNLTPDVSQNISYSTFGEKTILFRVNYTDGSYKESKTKIEVKKAGGASAARYVGLNIEEFQFPLPNFQPPREYLGEIGGALVTVEYTNAAREIRRPLIVVEGFDPWQILTPEDPLQNNGFQDVIAGGVGGLNIFIDYTHNGIFYPTLSDALEGEQYDLIFIDFEDGTDHIQRNAFVVQNVIEWVNQRKVAIAGVMQQNVVIGFSMGGLVARYALRDMELNGLGIPHDTRLYASFDSPHQGANVPVGFQAMVSHLSGTGIGFGLPGLITVSPGGLTFGRLAPQLGRAFQMLNSPAARQMLRYQVNGEGSLLFHDNSMHTDFLDEYSDMGYPVGDPVSGGIRNVVIANGSECGENQGYAPYAEFVNVNETLELWWWSATLSQVIAPYSLLTNYPQLIIGLLSTRSEVKAKFIVNALPNQTSQRIYHGEVYVRKKILWVINVNVTLFSKEFNSDPSYLPLDNTGGGVSDIGDIVDNLPVTLNITRFNFIPTYSALDIGGGTQPIINTDLSRAYSPASPPGAPKNVIAANFFTNPTEGGISNEIHTQITLRNGRWLFQEIEQVPAFFSCSYVCEGTATSPFITGPNEICSENASYTLNNPSGAANFTWDRSANLNYISGQGTQTYTVSRNTNGEGFVQVVLGGGCGNSNPINMNVTVGGVGYNSSDYPVTGPSSVCTDQNALYSTNYLPLATYYSWFWPTDWDYLEGQGTRFLNLHIAFYSTSGTIGVRVATACDEGGSPATLFTTVSSCGSFMMTAYPNPAQDELIIESTSEDSTSESSETANYSDESISFSAKLYDASGALQKKGNSKNGNLIIKINDLPDGQYFLHITTDVETVSSQIIIKR